MATNNMWTWNMWTISAQEKSQRDFSNRKDVSIEDHLRPVYFSMKLFGMDFREHPQRFMKLTPSKVYHLIVMAGVWFSVVRYFFAYSFGEKFDLPLVFKILNHVTYLMVASSFVGANMTCRIQPTFLNSWRTYLNTYNVQHSASVESRRRRRLLVTTVLVWICIAGSFFIYVTAPLNPDVQWTLRPQMLPFEYPCVTANQPWHIMVLVIIYFVYSFAITFLQMNHLFLLTFLLTEEFSLFNKDFQDKFQTESLEHWRQRHLKLCQLTRQLDDGFGLYILLYFTSSIPMCCFVLYIVIMGQYPLAERMAVWARMLPNLAMCLTSMLVITYCGTKLNEEAVHNKSFLYSMRLDGSEWTRERILQYRMFYQKLTSGRIGLTGWHLFYVDKTTVKMIILLIVTYTVMLLKFGTSSSSPLHCCHNNTATDMDIPWDNSVQICGVHSS